MSITTTRSIKRNPVTNKLQSGYDPTGQLGHGDTFYMASPSIPASDVSLRVFLGGSGSNIENAAVGTTIVPPSGWTFTEAATPPKIYNDMQRGKVLYNDYNAMADIDATKAYSMGTQLGYGEKLYYSRLVKPVVKTTAGVDYPTSSQLQWKTDRFNFEYSISDTNNVTSKLLNSSWFGGNGKQYTRETGDGFVNGQSTGGNTSTSLKDTSLTFGVNTLKGRGLQLTGGTGSGQFSLIASNSGPEIIPVFAFSPVPDATTTYQIQSATNYGTDDVVINAGWQRVEWFIQNNTLNAADGSVVRKIWRDGVLLSAIDLQNTVFQQSTKAFKHILSQDYFGNNTLPITSKEIYSDDLVVRRGAFDRVAIMDTDNISTATVYELQPDATWSAGSITGKINKGALTTGNYYLCAITGINTVVHSMAVTLK